MALTPPVDPMLARAVDVLPPAHALPGGLAFEPKWDGYRLLVFHTQGRVYLQSQVGTDLTTAFPEIADAAALLPQDTVIDGEAVIYQGGRLDFSALQHRLNRPAATTARLAREHPAHLVAFDLLQQGDTELLRQPYRERRAGLEALFEEQRLRAPWSLTPVTADREQAEEWLRTWPAVGAEGLVVKGLGQSYRPGQRGWIKIRARDTAEAVIGAVTGAITHPDSVLLGRYDAEGVLRLVARSTQLSPALQKDLGRLLQPAAAGHPWTGMRITSTWGSRDALAFSIVEPEHVAEFHGDTAVDHGRWRHPVRLLRIRADMAIADAPAFGADLPPAES